MVRENKRNSPKSVCSDLEAFLIAIDVRLVLENAMLENGRS